MKKISLMSLAAAMAQGKDVQDGRCPHPIGSIKGKMSEGLDMKAIQGKWINLYDEKELKDQFLCMSAKLLQFDDNNEKELSF